MPITQLTSGTPLAKYYKQIRSCVGDMTRSELGLLDPITIGRYALTIGATDPIHFDKDAAVSAGYDDVVAPVNLLSAIFEWGVGTAESALNIDGTPPGGDTATGSADLRLRAMGAGEEMVLVNPVTAHMRLFLESTISEVNPKLTRGGECVFVIIAHDFLADDGTVLNKNKRTLVLRNPGEER